MRGRAMAFAALLLVSCDRGPSPSPSPTPSPMPSPMLSPSPTPSPSPSPPASTIEAVAQIVPDADGLAVLAPTYLARIDRIVVRPGDRVAAGAPLITLSMPELAVEAARAVGASDRLEALATRRAAVNALVAEGLARGGDLAELDARAAELRAERAVALAAVRSGGLGDTASAARSRGRLTLTAPIAGVVTEVAAQVGALHGPDGGALLRIASNQGRRVVARFATAPPAGAATLRLTDGQSRSLTFVSQAVAEVGVDAWYDVDGEPLAATTLARVIIEVAP